MHVLICGGGVIGASVAYFLTCHGVKATVIESTGLACAASGKSGGFLATQEAAEASTVSTKGLDIRPPLSLSLRRMPKWHSGGEVVYQVTIVTANHPF